MDQWIFVVYLNETNFYEIYYDDEQEGWPSTE